MRHVRCARDTGHVALCFGIFGHPLRVVFFLLLQGVRFIWNLSAFDYSLTRRYSTDSAELPKRAGLRRMIQQVPICSIHGLPNAVKIRPAIESWRAICGRLSNCWNDCDEADKQKSSKVAH